MGRQSKSKLIAIITMAVLCLPSISEASGLNKRKSPVTTKGDIYTFSTGDTKIAVGANGQILSADSSTATGLKWVNSPTSGSSGAPTGASYIVQTADSALTNEQALSSLATGYMKVTTTTGVVSSQAVPIPLADGGTNKVLVASNGAMPYSDADSLELLAATATAGQVLRSGASSAPSWSTATYPSIATGTGTILRADGTNWVASTATYPGSATNAARILRADGTNWAETTSTFADTYAASGVLYANGSNNVAGLATANNSILVTSASGVPSISSTTPAGLTLTTPRFVDNGNIQDSNGNELLAFRLKASAVNYIVISNDVTTKSPTIIASGDDANVGLLIATKGTGVISTDHAFVTRPINLLDAATIETDASQGNTFIVTLGGNRTLNTPTNPTNNQKAIWIISQDATGSRTLSYSPNFRFGTTVTSPTLSTTAGMQDYIGAIYRIRGVQAKQQSWDVCAVVLGYQS